MSARMPIETRKVRTHEVGAMMRAGWATGCAAGDGLVLMSRPQRTATDWREARIAALEAELAEARTKLADAALCIERLEAKVAPPRLERVVAIVAEAFGVGPRELFGRSQCRRVVRARQACFALASAHARCSLADLGGAFDRDHSTVGYGIGRARSLVEHDRDYAGRFRAAEARLALRQAPDGGAP